MLVDRHQQMNMFETIMPECVGKMDPELQQIDQLLDNDTVFAAVKNDLLKRYPQTARRGGSRWDLEQIVLGLKIASDSILLERYKKSVLVSHRGR